MPQTRIVMRKAKCTQLSVHAHGLEAKRRRQWGNAAAVQQRCVERDHDDGVLGRWCPRDEAAWWMEEVAVAVAVGVAVAVARGGEEKAEDIRCTERARQDSNLESSDP
ncbi:hypothetical protein TcWFU_006683 [Taenia crassiceps]|uniref:Uncharacterized protein n=1 Tax=Taenia crassiceps TaxID=6207 RepID=A0ABR4QDX3_9CEST